MVKNGSISSLFSQIHSYIWQHFISTSVCCSHLEAEKNKLSGFINTTIEKKLSSCGLLIGNDRNANQWLVDSVISEILALHHGQIDVVSLDGISCHNAISTLLNISNQLNIICQTENDFNLLMNGILLSFQDSLNTEKLVILVFSDFEQFIKGERQRILYTLLDYIHRKDCLFMVIGIDLRADLLSDMDKRILSRINAMTITLPPPPAKNICENLKARLDFMVPLEEIISDFRNLPYEDKLLLNNYVLEYNQQIAQLFDASLINESSLTNNNSKKRSASVKVDLGQAYQTIHSGVRIGKNISYYSLVVQSMLLAFPLYDILSIFAPVDDLETVSTTTTTNPAEVPAVDYALILSRLRRILAENLSLTSFLQASNLQDSCGNLSYILNGLPLYQLYVFAAVTRLQGRLHSATSTPGRSTKSSLSGVTTSSSHNSSSSSSHQKNANMITIQEVRAVCEEMMGGNNASKQVPLRPETEIISAFQSLFELKLIIIIKQNGSVLKFGEEIVSSLRVELGVSYIQACETFKFKNEPDLIKINDRVKEAVLNPNNSIQSFLLI